MNEGAKPGPRARLRRLGVSERQCEWLLRNYDLAVIEQQLDWLPFRNPRKPASIIVEAIRRNYEKPSILETSDDNGSDTQSNSSSEFSPIPEIPEKSR